MASSSSSKGKPTRDVDWASILISIFLGWLVGAILDCVVERRRLIQTKLLQVVESARKRGEVVLNTAVTFSPFLFVSWIVYWRVQTVSTVSFLSNLGFGILSVLLASAIIFFLENKFDRYFISGEGEKTPTWWNIYIYSVAALIPLVTIILAYRRLEKYLSGSVTEWSIHDVWLCRDARYLMSEWGFSNLYDRD